MAEPTLLSEFRPADRFLRRVGLPGQIKRRIVHWRAFKEKESESTLSLTFMDAGLQQPGAVDQYRQHFSQFLDGNLPGILWLSFEGLTQQIEPPQVPRPEPDLCDSVYGHLHCVIDAPRDRAVMELLAKLVNDGDHGGIMHDFVRLAPPPPRPPL